MAEAVITPAPVAAATEAKVQTRAEKINELSKKLIKDVPKKVEPIAEVKTETVVPVVAKAPKEEDDFVRRSTALNKIEQRLNKRQEEMKAQEAEITEARKFKETLKLAQSNPAKFAEETGLKLSDLANQTMKPQEFDFKRQNSELTDRLKKLEELNTKSIEEAKQKEQDKLANEYASKITQHINSVGDKFPIVKEYGNGAIQKILGVIADYFKESGEELPWEQATQYIEDRLMQEKIEDFNKLSKIEKIRAKLNLGVETITEPVKRAEVSAKAQGISNASASAPAEKDLSKNKKEERRRRMADLTTRIYKQ